MNNNILAYVKGEKLEDGIRQLKDAGVTWGAVRIIENGKESEKYKLLIMNIEVENGIIKNIYFD